MLMALRIGLVLSRAGQASTHRLQPVQSSGATWMVNFIFGKFLELGIDRFESCRSILAAALDRTLFHG